MPTGFTAPIYDGEDITFEQFANSCLRNFGIITTRRATS